MDRFVCIVTASCWGCVSFRKSLSPDGVVFKKPGRLAAGIRYQGAVLVNKGAVLPKSRFGGGGVLGEVSRLNGFILHHLHFCTVPFKWPKVGAMCRTARPLGIWGYYLGSGCKFMPLSGGMLHKSEWMTLGGAWGNRL